MPYIRFGTNVPVTKAQEQELRESLGKLIELIPGKTEKVRTMPAPSSV